MLVLLAAALMATLGTWATPPAQAQTGETKTVAVVAARGYDDLLAKIDYLGQYGGQVNAGQQIDNMLLMFTQNKGLEGVDKSKPWGAVVQTDGFQFTPIVCLPVTDLDALLEVVKAFGMTTSDTGDGIIEVQAPNQSLYVKQDGNWAYVAQTAEVLANSPSDPVEPFEALTADYDLAARVMLQNVPEMYRSMAVDQLRAGAEQGLEQQTDESDEAFQARKEMTEANIDQIVQTMQEMDEITLGMNSDVDAGKVYLDFLYSGLPGTQVAQAVAAYESASTQFAGCLKDGAAVRMNLTVDTPPALLEDQRPQIEVQIEALRQQANNAIDQEAELPNEASRTALKDAVGDLLDAVEATALTGRFDVAGHMDATPDSLSIVAGGFAKETSKIESAAKKLAALLEEEESEFSGVNWDADSHQGASIHTMSIPVPAEEEDARRMMGETLDVALALGDEVVFFAAGADCVATLKQAMDSSGSGTTVKPAQLSIALTPLVRLAAESEEGDPVADAILEALTTKAEGEDHIHLTAEAVDNKFRARFELEKGVLEAIGAAANAARQQGAAAGF